MNAAELQRVFCFSWRVINLPAESDILLNSLRGVSYSENITISLRGLSLLCVFIICAQ